MGHSLDNKIKRFDLKRLIRILKNIFIMKTNMTSPIIHTKSKLNTIKILQFVKKKNLFHPTTKTYSQNAHLINFILKFLVLQSVQTSPNIIRFWVFKYLIKI